MGLVCYGAFKDHLSLFPMSIQAIEHNQKALEPFVSGKGTIRFTTERPLPAALVKKIVKARIAEVDARKRR
jgi:uncharacterized protein YdhG (YjbR/CyaY superfamily)